MECRLRDVLLINAYLVVIGVKVNLNEVPCTKEAIKYIVDAREVTPRDL